MNMSPLSRALFAPALLARPCRTIKRDRNTMRSKRTDSSVDPSLLGRGEGHGLLDSVGQSVRRRCGVLHHGVGGCKGRKDETSAR